MERRANSKSAASSSRPFIFGSFTIYLRFIYDLSSVHLRFIACSFTVYLRFMLGSFTVGLRILRGSVTVRSRFIRDSCSFHLRSIHGSPPSTRSRNSVTCFTTISPPTKNSEGDRWDMYRAIVALLMIRTSPPLNSITLTARTGRLCSRSALRRLRRRSTEHSVSDRVSYRGVPGGCFGVDPVGAFGR